MIHISGILTEISGGNSESVFRQRFNIGTTKGRDPHHQALLDEIWPDGAKSNLYNLNSGKRRQSRFPYSKQRSRDDLIRRETSRDLQPNTRESLTITM